MKGKTSQLLPGFLFRRVSSGSKRYQRRARMGEKKGRDSNAKEMYCLNNFYRFFGGGYIDLFFLSSHNLSNDLETIIAASMGKRDQTVEIMTI